jgi:hypothetical protein
MFYSGTLKIHVYGIYNLHTPSPAFCCTAAMRVRSSTCRDDWLNGQIHKRQLDANTRFIRADSAASLPPMALSVRMLLISGS